MKGFLGDARDLIAIARPTRVLEVGCGPGDLALHLFGPEGGAGDTVDYVGTDISEEEIAKAREQCPGRSFQAASIYRLPFDSGSFDLVIACEVFEHLERPEEALREIERIGSSHLLVSVPWEPVWRILNVLRGKYLSRLGNSLGHVQHFSREGIRRVVRSRFDIVAERRPLPWTMLLAKRRMAPARVDAPGEVDRDISGVVPE